MSKKGAVAVIADKLNGYAPRGPDLDVIGFARRGDLAYRMGEVYMAKLLGPKFIFRHEGETPKGTKPDRVGDAPAGFFHHFAMQSGERAFARINPAAG